MEPVSLTLGVLSLVGVFNDALQLNSYIDVARRSTEQHVDCKLRLRAAALRLARWVSASQLDSVPVDGIEAINAELQNSFDKHRDKDAEENNSNSMCDTMRRISTEALHPKKHTMSVKAKWVIKESRELPAIISIIDGHIKNLDHLFPLARTTRDELALKQALLLAAYPRRDLLVRDLRVRDLRPIQETRDEAFLQAIAKFEQAGGATSSMGSVNATFGDNNSGFQSGVMSGGVVNFSKIEVFATHLIRGTVHQGVRDLQAQRKF